MQYKGKYKIFAAARIQTYPLSTRTNKVTLSDIISPAEVAKTDFNLTDDVKCNISAIAKAIVSARKDNKPVIVLSGASLNRLQRTLTVRLSVKQLSKSWRLTV